MEYVYPAIELVSVGAIKTMGYNLRVFGKENIPQTGPALLASNHVGYLDFVFSGYAALKQGRRVRFTAKKEIWRSKVAAFLMDGMHHIPVDRYEDPQAAYRAAHDALVSGEIVGMFPEGTISTSFVPIRGKTGSARLAQAAGAPLLPVGLWGTQRILTKHRPKNLQRKLEIIVNIGEPIQTHPEDDPRALTDELMSQIELLLKQAQERYTQEPADDTDRWWLPAHMGGTAPRPEDVVDKRRGPDKPDPEAI
jgi:1-acyl-sn-glycerol-3-phosphate acyltransferase